ncbi:MAG: alpha/beta hydrolase [Gammaproteobacteria bacterium]|nr:alpha/beta hydrolase [Gammaproteobacteria bacterium]MYF28774.1 alpha/beta hydrolase [Gammaproteobacteria bacterium]MYK46790.1 alpha/beta hydrolase [Gammaproteobacteria bacterium]
MAFFERGEVNLYYEIHGEGYPVLLFAPGGMRSAVSFWRGSEWDPIEALSPHFQVIAMDQRNAGQSRAPVTADDGWHTYTSDHVALLDHLGIEKTHVMGGCIGGPYSFGVIERHPARITAAVLQQSIGDSGENRELFHAMFDQWANPLKPSMPSVSEETWSSFRSNMFDHEFVYNVSREFVASCQTPLLVLMGSDPYHPEATSREIAELAPNAQLIEAWKNADADGTVEAVVEFLKANTPRN